MLMRFILVQYIVCKALTSYQKNIMCYLKIVVFLGGTYR